MTLRFGVGVVTGHCSSTGSGVNRLISYLTARQKHSLNGYAPTLALSGSVGIVPANMHVEPQKELLQRVKSLIDGI
ncbi:hypothetical protein KSF_108440 [Reticulibacter mediterranei]|uniref:Uncharacterized protein n=1 Tax=Reticulibacter mediterranei TaxID=2778369 RepID=A0A8J3IU01_9CHLR|nr:hypothetical protein KSF_108440 [Reticulibacter mediterranei]